MSKHHVQVSSGGRRVILETIDFDVAEMVRKSEFLTRYVPNAEVNGSESHAGDCPRLSVERGDRVFKMSYPTCVYHNDTIDEKDVVSVLEMLLERDRQEQGVYCLHSSAAEVDGKGIIFWGGTSGMGKTTLALSFDGIEGSSVYSDEKTLINAKTLEMMGGVNTAYITKGEISEKHGLGYLNLDRPDDSRIPLRFLIQPQVIPGADLLVEEMSAEKTEWHMYEELTRKIRGTSRRLFGNTWPVQSIDTDGVAKKRSSDSARISRSVRSYFMRGDADAIRDEILKMLS